MSVRNLIAALMAALLLFSERTDTQVPASGTANSENQAKVRGGPFLRQITLFDRQGNVRRTLGEPGLYSLPAFSPDATRLAVVRQEAGPRPGRHIWVLDVSTGGGTQLTFDPAGESAPVWSSDGKSIAYTSRRANVVGVYRKASNGTGREQLLYRHTVGAGLTLTDWSPDGRVLSFYSGGVLYALPLSDAPRPIELVREEYEAYNGRFSPDNRFLAYGSDESGRNEIYVRPFDMSVAGFSTNSEKWPVSTQDIQPLPPPVGTQRESCYGNSRNCIGPVYWRQDRSELLYVAPDGALMAVEVRTAPTFQAARPRLLFETSGNGTTSSVSRDGQRVAVAVPLPTDRRVVAVAPEILRTYVGTYVEPGLERAIVTLEGNQLIVQGESGQKQRLLAESSTYFFVRGPEGDSDREFFTDSRGVVTHFIHYVGRGITYTRE